MLTDPSIAWIFCGLQITLLAMVALSVGAWLIKRRPDLAAIPSTAALLTGFCLVMLTATNVPRPLKIVHKTKPVVAIADELSSAPLIKKTDRYLEQNTQHDPKVLSSSSVSGLSVGRLLEIVNGWSVEVVPGKSQAKTITLWVACGFGLLLAIRFLVGLIALIRMAQSSTVIHCNQLNQQLHLLTPRIKFRKPVRLAMASCLASPCVSWISPSTIFLPTNFESWSDEEQLASLAHELAHLKRHDAGWRMLAELAWTFSCWHPLTLLLRRQVTLAQELSADQLAAQAIGSGAIYRKGLSKLALRLDAQSNGAVNSVSFLSTSVSSSSLIRRINMLKGFKLSEATSTTARLILARFVQLLTL